MSKEKFTSSPILCGSCGNSSLMEIAASAVRDDSPYDDGGPQYDASTTFEIHICPNCRNPILTASEWDQGMDYPATSVLYPLPSSMPLGLPDKIEEAYIKAQKVRPVEPDAYAIMAGKVLEFVCVDKGETDEKKKLWAKLKSLGDDGVLSPKLKEIADGLKDLRNFGTHSTFVEFTKKDVPLLESLVKAVLEHVYTAPFLAEQAKKQLAKLKATEGAKRKSVATKKSATTKKATKAAKKPTNPQK